MLIILYVLYVGAKRFDKCKYLKYLLFHLDSNIIEVRDTWEHAGCCSKNKQCVLARGMLKRHLVRSNCVDYSQLAKLFLECHLWNRILTSFHTFLLIHHTLTHLVHFLRIFFYSHHETEFFSFLTQFMILCDR